MWHLCSRCYKSIIYRLHHPNNWSQTLPIPIPLQNSWHHLPTAGTTFSSTTNKNHPNPSTTKTLKRLPPPLIAPPFEPTIVPHHQAAKIKHSHRINWTHYCVAPPFEPTTIYWQSTIPNLWKDSKNLLTTTNHPMTPKHLFWKKLNSRKKRIIDLVVLL